MYAWLIPAAMSLLGGYASYRGGKDLERAADQQDLLAQENKMLAQRELNEQVRRQEREDRRLRGSALARAAASGATISGSLLTSLEYMEEEQGKDINWMKSAGASRIRLDMKAANLRADATRTRGKTQKMTGLFSGILGATSFMGKGGYFSGSGSNGYTINTQIKGVHY